jgi:hypothetical protein
MVCIRSFWTRAEAELAASLLESAGVQSFVTADDFGGWIPIQFSKSAVRLFVSESNAEQAKCILKDELEEPVRPESKGKHWTVTGLKYFLVFFIGLPLIITLIWFFMLILRGCR